MDRCVRILRPNFRQIFLQKYGTNQVYDSRPECYYMNVITCNNNDVITCNNIHIIISLLLHVINLYWSALRSYFTSQLSRKMSTKILHQLRLRRPSGMFKLSLHTEKSFRNLIESTRNQIVFTIFLLIWNQTDVRLVPNQSENGKCNLISVWFNKISKRFLCVYGISTAVRRTAVREPGVSRLPD